ncbi:MAG: FtsX-like permease family protein [Gammaproteobacteria bacterium]|nr:FtsX-like permease family protein [Gammaproteobacteria bacterium]
MAEIAAEAAPATAKFGGTYSVATIAWRNLWRNGRRTWLTACGIAFAVWMLVFGMSMQVGTFEIMIDNGARLGLGHIQIQHPEYANNPSLEHTIRDADRLESLLAAIPTVAVASPRAMSFALASSTDRSFGTQVIGVDFAKEASWSTLPDMQRTGRYLAGPGEAFVGSVLARNLGLAIGDEMVLLGTAKEGGVAAAVAEIVGTFTTGQAALDRALVQIPLEDFRAGWELAADEVHMFVVLADSVADSEVVARGLKSTASVPGTGWIAQDWRDLMPEAEQTIDLKYIGMQFFFAMLVIIVTFSVVNTFMMTIFERTPEFGMLMAIGMRPGSIMLQLLLEAFWLAALGVLLGMAISGGLVAILASTGMPLPADAAEMLKQYNLPDRIYPKFSTDAAWTATIVMLLGTQIAAIVPALRIRRMRPIEALRAKE